MTRLYNVVAVIECPRMVNHGKKVYLSDIYIASNDAQGRLYILVKAD